MRPTSADFTAIDLAACLGLACVALLAIHILKCSFRTCRRPINFYITDIWAGMLGLVPSFLLIRYLSTLSIDKLSAWLFALGVVSGQCVGAVWGLLEGKLMRTEQLPGRFNQAASVFAGSMAGCIVAVAFLSLLYFIADSGGICFATAIVPLFLIAVIKGSR
ncbi:MAG TPA: hypothetical protein VKX17_12405 [Planctomycetota bacterium]|nr:hypothetical protein [Planctomycetota bacterium]